MGRRRTVASPHPSFDTKPGQERCEGLWRERKSKSYKRSKRHVTQEDTIYQVNQKLPEEEVGNLKKRWNTYPGTWAITAEHRWMGGERTEELSVSHESEKEIMSRRMAQVLPGPAPPPQDPGGRR